jgi:hypothetical protein
MVTYELFRMSSSVADMSALGASDSRKNGVAKAY